MDTLKIIKLAENKFKHCVNNNEDESFYSAKMSIDFGTISINTGTFNRDFYLGGVELYDINSETPLLVTDMDDFAKKLEAIRYNGLISGNNSIVKNSDDYTSISIAGRIRDQSQDVVQDYGDGTTQTIYFTTDGEFAGRSKRE